MEKYYQNHYCVTYEAPEDFPPVLTQKITFLNFLLDNKAFDLRSFVGTTIYFRSENDYSFWVEKFRLLNDEYYYHLMKIEMELPNTPIMGWHADTYHVEHFDQEVEILENTKKNLNN